MVQRELKQSYRLCMDSNKRHPAARHTASSASPLTPVHRYEGGSQSLLPNISQVSFLKTSAAAEGKGFIQASPETAHGVTLKDLNRMTRNIPAFTPELAGEYDVYSYLREIDFFLQPWTSVNHQDRLYLLWITCSPEVQRFLARQPGHIQSDYQQLKQAIIKEFSDPEFEHGLIATLAIEQGRHETPRDYYHRLRRAYYGARSEPGMEADTGFKSLFIRNLHPIVSHHIGIRACPTMPVQQLRDLTQKAFNKHKASTKGVCKTPLNLNCTTQNPKQAPEGTQHCHNARPFYRKPLASRGKSRCHGNRPRSQTSHWQEPWKRPSSSCEHHGMSNDSPPQHPPPHPSHRCQTDVAQGQPDTPTSELQELLILAKELLEIDSTEEYCEGQTSDSLPDATQHQTPPRVEHPLQPVDTPEAARQRWVEQRAHMPNSETSTNTTQASSSRCRHKSKAAPQTSDFW